MGAILSIRPTKGHTSARVQNQLTNPVCLIITHVAQGWDILLVCFLGEDGALWISPLCLCIANLTNIVLATFHPFIPSPGFCWHVPLFEETFPDAVLWRGAGEIPADTAEVLRNVKALYEKRGHPHWSEGLLIIQKSLELMLDRQCCAREMLSFLAHHLAVLSLDRVKALTLGIAY